MKQIIVVSVLFLIAIVSGCVPEDGEDYVEPEAVEPQVSYLDGCIDAELYQTIIAIEKEHGMDVILEFFQYKGKDYLDIVVGFYPGDDWSIEGFFYVGDNRAIFRSTDSCSVDMIKSCAYDAYALELKGGPPHELSQYSYLIDEDGDLELIESFKNNGTGRLVVDNGYIDTLFYRSPWPEVYPDAPSDLEKTIMSDTSQIHEAVEEAPEYPGGMTEMYSFLGSNIIYPQYAQDNNIQGKVYVQFVVEKDGSITDVNVIKGVHAVLDKEAVRVISNMPNWKPGKQRGLKVRVRYTIPINFTIN